MLQSTHIQSHLSQRLSTHPRNIHDMANAQNINADTVSTNNDIIRLVYLLLLFKSISIINSVISSSVSDLLSSFLYYSEVIDIVMKTKF